jgi:hypothetical protein
MRLFAVAAPRYTFGCDRLSLLDLAGHRCGHPLGHLQRLANFHHATRLFRNLERSEAFYFCCFSLLAVLVVTTGSYHETGRCCAERMLYMPSCSQGSVLVTMPVSIL